MEPTEFALLIQQVEASSLHFGVILGASIIGVCCVGVLIYRSVMADHWVSEQ